MFRKPGKVVLCVIYILFSWSGLTQELKDRELKKLEKGNILVESVRDPKTGDRVSSGKIIFQAPVEIVWSVLTDYSAYPDFLPDVKKLKIKKRTANQLWLEMAFKSIWPFPDFTAQILMEEFEGSRMIKFQKQKGDFERYYGSYKLKALDENRTFMEFRFYQDIGWWWLPFTPNYASNNSKVEDYLKAFRKQVFQAQVSKSKPGEVIKPYWKKSIFKDKKKKEKAP